MMPDKMPANIFAWLGLPEGATHAQIAKACFRTFRTFDARDTETFGVFLSCRQFVDLLAAIEQRGREAGRKEAWERMQVHCCHMASGQQQYCYMPPILCTFDACQLLAEQEAGDA